jgi:hypothetical protein
MRSRLMLGSLAAGIALSLAPQASAAEPVNCHHVGWLCEAIEGAQPSINCHHIGWLCTTIDQLIGGGA